MAQMGRPGMSAQEKAELWRRWKQGESLSDIARVLKKGSGSVFGVLRLRGGIAPVAQRRSRLVLTRDEREEISRGIAAGHSLRMIASRIKRAPSTVSREITRNGGDLRYRAGDAEERAWDRAKRPKKCRLAMNARLRLIVAGKLKMQWSPQQIAGWLKTQFPKDPSLQISHEAIYQTLFVQARGALKKELQRHLRSGRVMRHGRTATRRGQTRYQIVDAVSIRERPPEIEDRSVPGHWEGDLLCGSGNTHIAHLLSVNLGSRFWLNCVAKTRKPLPKRSVGRFESYRPRFVGHLRSIADQSSQLIGKSASQVTSKSTSAIQRARGNEERTKTRTASCGNTSQMARTFPNSLKCTSTALRFGSTDDHGRRCTTRRQQVN